ncbi:hypothetical protein EZV62_012462 [Acer yangbiense]|uniref:Transposase MuDR plant domain-containing protein n=1 Tax=Acer yangbiense TaxID=1000413 RepID=A0A5C7HWI8_9ROSI|nr:hypothetical protein EZV62_012462 [Acer yangbiense]
MYTMAQLWADVYMCCCCTFPEPSEGFKAKVRLPWCAEFKLLKDDKDLQVIFKMFTERKLSTIRVDFELQPFANLPLEAKDVPHAHMDSSSSSTNGTPSRTEVSADFLQISIDDDEEEYVPYSGSGWKADANDENDSVDDEVAGKDKDIAESDNNSTDEQLSNATSFQFDEEFMEVADNDEEEGQSRPRRRRPFRVTNDGRVALEFGQLFHNLHQFRIVLRDFAVQEGFELKRVKNDKERYTAFCAYEGCTWRIHASPVEDRRTFMIKTLQNRHSCQKLQKNHEATAVWVARRFKCLIEQNPEIKVKFLGREIQRIYGLTLPSYTLYRAKNRVLQKTEKEHSESFDKLYNYGYIVRQRNPGSMTLLKTITPDLGAPSRFQRFFLSLQAQKDGYIFGCRPFIGLDGCHLKGKYPGVLLSAIAVDANSGVFPIAICICEGESKDSWGWFLQQLYCHIGLDDNRRVTFMSDCQKGVIDAIERFWPRSNTRHCVRHITANLQAKYKGQLSAVYVWNAANKSNKSDFLAEMENLKEANIDAYNYMMNIPLKHWALYAFDAYVKSEHTTNNITESFNGWIDNYRELPTLSMMESIRRKLMK